MIRMTRSSENNNCAVQMTQRCSSKPQDVKSEALRYNVFSDRCISRKLLTDVSRRWSVLILSTLRTGPKRFGELNDTIEGMSERMLSITLKTLLHDHLVVRVGTTSCSTYELTPAGMPIAAKADELFEAVYSALDHMDPSEIDSAAAAAA
jgi:DNA-binding HxlR family transcriptional regulator